MQGFRRICQRRVCHRTCSELFSRRTRSYHACDVSIRGSHRPLTGQVSPKRHNLSSAAATLPEDDVIYPVEDISQRAHVGSMAAYEDLHAESLDYPRKFWKLRAEEDLTWFAPFRETLSGSFEHGDVRWFADGKLNAATNCIDRHVEKHGDRTAIIFEADEPGDSRSISYRELFHEVCRLANALKARGVKKGDRVCIYMPMVPEAAYAMLACARIGAVHSVVFAGFSSDALRQRIVDSDSKLVITADEGVRGGRVIPLKPVVDEALLGVDHVKSVLVHRRTGGRCVMHPTRDLWMDEVMKRERPYCAGEIMDSEDPLFILYTSGSTGTPKGLVHTTAGYLLGSAVTHRLIFDYHHGDIYACVADIGWITGHSYVVYGPLCNGATTVMFESTPLYPDASRYWDMVERHKITQLYTSPTAIRSLMKHGIDPLQGKNLSSLRVIGSVGEPINPEAWNWVHKNVGKENCAIVDTYWQTETGSVIVAPYPGATPTKPGSATLAQLGIDLALSDPITGEIKEDGSVGEGHLVIRKPFPSIARTIFNDHGRYLESYFSQVKGAYYAGDACYRDKDGYIWITGRVDDVITKAGHRLGSAEIESALVTHAACMEAAVVAIDDDVKGQAIVGFCSLRHGWNSSDELIQELKQAVRAHIGGLAVPDHLILSPSLPKTRSGKIMRRILRKIAKRETSPEQLGDTSTLAEPAVVDLLIEKMEDNWNRKSS